MRPRRPHNPRPRKRTVLIQCEGQKTEPNYLDDLCKACRVRQRAGVTIKAGEGNAKATVRAAIKESGRRLLGENIYDEVWCVLDVEDAAHEATLNEAIALAQKNNIRLFLSNPCFEVWLISHFERTKRAFANGGAAEAYLSQTYWQKHFGCDYDKGDERLYEKLAGRVGEAMGNAQWVLETFHGNAHCLDSNASTEVYQLVRELLQV